MSARLYWAFSLAASAIAVYVLVEMWTAMSSYQVKNPDDTDRESPQLVDKNAVDDFLGHRWPSCEPTSAVSVEQCLTRIPTGIFVQSLRFLNSVEVNVTGYIWQKFNHQDHPEWFCPDGTLNCDPDARKSMGFILPEQVDSNFEPRIEYQVEQIGKHNKAELVVGWYFEATLRQPFRYLKYPFDHKTVWLRLWPKQFSEAVVLEPDFAGYGYHTDLIDKFGIEESIVLGAWDREDTYFDYQLADYSTNFGIDNYVGQEQFPELRYNFVLKRRISNGLIVHLLPLFLVAALLYGALLTMSTDKNIAERHGFSTSNIIGTCSALFFVVLLAHIQLREQFGGSPIVFMEYFYFMMYGVLVLSSVYAFHFSKSHDRATGWSYHLFFRDNLLLKIGYWPVILCFMIIITASFISK